MGKSNKVSLKEIALNLNLSINSVSHALRDLDDISEDTKERVRKEAIRLGYQGKKYNLQITKSHTIALIFDSFLNPYFAVMGQKIVEMINLHKYDLVVVNTNEFKKVDTDIIKKCIYRKIDLIVSFNEIEENASEIAKINSISILLIGRKTKIPYIDYISTDDIKGGELAAQYLLDKGSKKLCYIYEINSESSERRMAGFLNVVNSKNIPYILVSKEDIYKNEELILEDGYDGIFVYNDRLLQELFFINKVFDLKKNNHINIVGFDAVLKKLHQNYDYATIDFDHDEIAKDAIEIIDERLRKSKSVKKRKHLTKDVWLNE